MNIHYRILKVDPASHGIVVRYFTDKVTETDLANSLNPDGSVILNADGYPLTTRTDVMLSIYDTPTPSQEEIEKRIMLNAPTDWLKLQEDIKDPGVDTKMSKTRKLVGDSKGFTTDELTELRESITNQETEDQSVKRAHDTITNLIGSLKILAVDEPKVIKDLYDVINDIKKTIDE